MDSMLGSMAAAGTEGSRTSTMPLLFFIQRLPAVPIERRQACAAHGEAGSLQPEPSNRTANPGESPPGPHLSAGADPAAVSAVEQALQLTHPRLAVHLRSCGGRRS